MKPKHYRMVVSILCLGTLCLSGINGAYGKQNQWPCEGNMKLLRDNRGKLKWFGPSELKKLAIHHVAPKIPSNCKCKGTIWVDLLVNTEGQVQCVRAKAGHPLLKRAAMEAAKQWRFKPSIIRGETVAVFGRLAFRFST